MATLREQIATNVLTVTKFRELLRDMRENRPNDDLELVRKAYEFSQKHHSGQQRASGEPYLVHPLEVALVLSEMKMDAVAVAAGLLHDSVEDTSVTIVDIRKEFGEQVAHIVEGVTKISKIDFSTQEEQRKKGDQVLSSGEQVLRGKIKEAGITASVESRIKRLYSIHKKLVKQRISVDQVYDLYAMRVITRSVQDCYAVLGIVHNLWRPVPGRIKDFIAMPRPNLYQSLHTSVITDDGTRFEIQIRNEELH